MYHSSCFNTSKIYSTVYYRDSLIVALINCGTSVFAGMVIFSVLGYMAHEKRVDIEDVVAGGMKMLA